MTHSRPPERRAGPGRPGWSWQRRPPWWPEDEPWPPPRRRAGWRPFGCLFGLVFVAIFVTLVALIAGGVGQIVAGGGPLGTVLRVIGVGLAVLGLVGLVVAGRTVRGSSGILDELTEAAARVEQGDFGARVDPRRHGPRPLRTLARSFNTMASRLDADERERRSLLADVSHELRTPLAVIQGHVEAILDGVHPADEAHLGAILDETRVLGRLVDDLRTLSLSEAGTLALHREPTDVGVLIADLVAALAPTAERSGGLGLTVEAPDDLPLADVDPVRIREVLANLVTNAIRHSPAGATIAIAARALPGPIGGEPAGTVEIEVRDGGGGIDPELLPHVFDRFRRGPDSPGSGLGLAIARSLVEGHGGTIEAASAPGRGTTITIRLPLRAPAEG